MSHPILLLDSCSHLITIFLRTMRLTTRSTQGRLTPWALDAVALSYRGCHVVGGSASRTVAPPLPRCQSGDETLRRSRAWCIPGLRTGLRAGLSGARADPAVATGAPDYAHVRRKMDRTEPAILDKLGTFKNCLRKAKERRGGGAQERAEWGRMRALRACEGR